MPDFGIVDAHVHLWDTRRLSYDWLRGNAVLERPYLSQEYQAACGDTNVDAIVFAECDVARGMSEVEVRLVEEQALRDPRIKAIIARASLEEGAAILPFLQHLKSTTPLLRGIRRMIEFEPDLDFCLRPPFIEGVKAVGSLGLSFDICINYRHMERLLRFVDLVGDMPLMLDHCGKPGIREGIMEPWHSQMRTLGSYPNVICKLSGLPNEADRRSWNAAQIRPYIDAVVEAFGFERLVYGGDWPACLQASTLPDWIDLLDRSFSGVPSRDLIRLYRDNAIDFYRLDLIR